MQILYLSHPQVQIDPAVPIPKWGLSPVGRARIISALEFGLFHQCASIVSSDETKAVEAADLIGKALNLPIQTRADMGENDRSATGFLPADEFESTADRFFARPGQSIMGWERAIDAQTRIVAAAKRELQAHLDGNLAGDLLMVGHGAVGTLLWCHVAGVDINRDYDQMAPSLAGGGNVLEFSVESGGLTPRHHWRSMEELQTHP